MIRQLIASYTDQPANEVNNIIFTWAIGTLAGALAHDPEYRDKLHEALGTHMPYASIQWYADNWLRSDVARINASRERRGKMPLHVPYGVPGYELLK